MTRDPESSVLRLPATVYEDVLKRENDDMVLEVAANCGADAILTHEKRGFERGESTFGIRILAPGAFLRALEEQP